MYFEHYAHAVTVQGYFVVVSAKYVCRSVFTVLACTQSRIGLSVKIVTVSKNGVFNLSFLLQ